MTTNDKNNLINTTKDHVTHKFGTAVHKKISNKNLDSAIKAGTVDRVIKLQKLVDAKKTLESITSVDKTLKINLDRHIETAVKKYIQDRIITSENEIEKIFASVLVKSAQIFADSMKNAYNTTETESVKVSKPAVASESVKVSKPAVASESVKVSKPAVASESVKVSKPAVASESVTLNSMNAYVAKKTQKGLYKEIVISKHTAEQILKWKQSELEASTPYLFRELLPIIPELNEKELLDGNEYEVARVGESTSQKTLCAAKNIYIIDLNKRYSRFNPKQFPDPVSSAPATTNTPMFISKAPASIYERCLETDSVYQKEISRWHGCKISKEYLQEFRSQNFGHTPEEYIQQKKEFAAEQAYENFLAKKKLATQTQKLDKEKTSIETHDAKPINKKIELTQPQKMYKDLPEDKKRPLLDYFLPKAIPGPSKIVISDEAKKQMQDWTEAELEKATPYFINSDLVAIKHQYFLNTDENKYVQGRDALDGQIKTIPRKDTYLVDMHRRRNRFAPRKFPLESDKRNFVSRILSFNYFGIKNTPILLSKAPKDVYDKAKLSSIQKKDMYAWHGETWSGALLLKFRNEHHGLTPEEYLQEQKEINANILYDLFLKQEEIARQKDAARMEIEVLLASREPLNKESGIKEEKIVLDRAAVKRIERAKEKKIMDDLKASGKLVPHPDGSGRFIDKEVARLILLAYKKGHAGTAWLTEEQVKWLVKDWMVNRTLFVLISYYTYTQYPQILDWVIAIVAIDVVIWCIIRLNKYIYWCSKDFEYAKFLSRYSTAYQLDLHTRMRAWFKKYNWTKPFWIPKRKI